MPVGNAANNAWEIRRYGEVNTYDGREGVDSLSFERLPRVYFNITQNADGSVNVDSVSGASALYRLKLISVELLYFSFGSEVVDLRTAFNTADQPSVINGTAGADTLMGTDRADSITGLAGDDSITGLAGADTLVGGEGDDSLVGGAGNDVLDGGAGSDVAVFSGRLSDYAVTVSGASVTVSANTNSVDGRDTLSQVERLLFSDLAVNLTLPAVAASLPKANVDRIAELYVAFFNRVPDADGLQFWLQQFQAGRSVTSIAEDFYAAGVQFASLTGYSASATNTDFVNRIYRNVLGRPDGADADGLAFWTGELASGRATRGALVNTILDSAHTFKGHPTFGYVADLLDNKLVVARKVAIEWGLNWNTPQEAISKGMAIAAAVTPSNTADAVALVGLAPGQVSLGG